MRESSIRLCLRTIIILGFWEGGCLQEVVASGGSTVHVLLIGMLYAKETGIISSDRLGLRLMCTFTFFYN